MIKLTHAAMLAGAAFAMPALAQDAAQTTAPAAPAAPAPATSATVTDAEVTTFAKAALAVDKINKDTAIPAADKGKALADAVVASGLQPERFNQIASASGSDTALQARIQAAVTAEQQSAAPAPTAAPAPAATPNQ